VLKIELACDADLVYAFAWVRRKQPVAIIQWREHKRTPERSEPGEGDLGGFPQERTLILLTRRSSCFLGDPPPDLRFIASLGALPLASPYEDPSEASPGGLGGSPQERRLVQLTRRSLCFLGDPPDLVPSLRLACCRWEVRTKARAKRTRRVWGVSPRKARFATN
jgi:hypothetical protein